MAFADRLVDAAAWITMWIEVWRISQSAWLTPNPDNVMAPSRMVMDACQKTIDMISIGRGAFNCSQAFLHRACSFVCRRNGIRV